MDNNQIWLANRDDNNKKKSSQANVHVVHLRYLNVLEQVAQPTNSNAIVLKELR